MTGAGPGKLARLVLRGLARNPRRTVLTFVGLVISFFLFTSLESMLFTLESVVSKTASEAVLFSRPRDRVSFWRPSLPASYAWQIRDMPGVLAASPIRFHFGRGREEGSFAAVLGVEAQSYRAVKPLAGVADDEWNAFRESRTAGLVGRRMLETNGWRIGDVVTIRGGGRVPSLSFTVAGDIDGEDRFGGLAVVHLAYLQDVLGGEGRVTFIQARISHPDRSAFVARAIDEHFTNFRVPTESTSERAHVATLIGSLSDVLGAMRAIGYLTLFVTVLVVGNSVAMSVRERTVEMGTLRALGFGRGHVMGIVLGEAITVAFCGGVLGALVAYAAFSFGWIQLPAEARFQFVTDWTVLVRAAALAGPVGALAALQPAWGAVRLSITQALRYAD